jgi:hypothetical protein
MVVLIIYLAHSTLLLLGFMQVTVLIQYTSVATYLDRDMGQARLRQPDPELRRLEAIQRKANEKEQRRLAEEHRRLEEQREEQEWWDSLTEEQQATVLRNEKRAAKKKADASIALASLIGMAYGTFMGGGGYRRGGLW